MTINQYTDMINSGFRSLTKDEKFYYGSQDSNALIFKGSTFDILCTDGKLTIERRVPNKYNGVKI